MSSLDEYVVVGKAVADPTRVRILSALSVRGLCVCELVELMDLGQPAISRHLGILREAGLVDEVRQLLDDGLDPRAPAMSAIGYTSTSH